MNGADSLVPPNCWMGAGSPAKLVHSSYTSTLVLQSAQPTSPGATRSSSRPSCVGPADSIDEISLLSQLWLENWNASPSPCAYPRKFVFEPAAITEGSLVAELTLDSTPASPMLSTTVTPAATACELNWRVRSCVVSGMGYSPNDSLRMSGWSCDTA